MAPKKSTSVSSSELECQKPWSTWQQNSQNYGATKLKLCSKSFLWTGKQELSTTSGFNRWQLTTFLFHNLCYCPMRQWFTASENLTAGINDIGVPKIHSFHFVLLYDREKESGEEGVQTASQNLSSIFLSFFYTKVPSNHYTGWILTQFFRKLTEEKNVQLFHAEYCQSRHSVFLSNCTRRNIQWVTYSFCLLGIYSLDIIHLPCNR